ncbi:formin-like protein 5, partial [Thrips palmi]|uniref:Formin-like protein 5 n=1 Tax=Thrips palmi TaxID=161013 RepID=A0A6P8YQ28_THRPL
PHEVVLPSAFGVLPQAYAPLPPLPPLPPLSAPGLSTHPAVVLRSLNADVPLLLPALPATPTPLPALPVAPAVPVDHVSPVLRAGAPAILLLPQTSSSGVYHLSDQQHRFPPFLENVVNRVQNLFSSYVQVDPFNTPFGTPRPPTASAAATAAPASGDGNASTADITTTTTTTTSARTHGRGINLRLSPGVPGVAAPGGPGGLPRDVELLDGRLQQQTASDGADSRPGQPVAFAQATAQVHQQPLGPESEVDSYLPVGNANKGSKDKGDKGTAVDERPPPPATRPPSPYGYGRGVRGPPRGQHPGDKSYYRRP